MLITTLVGLRDEIRSYIFRLKIIRERFPVWSRGDLGYRRARNISAISHELVVANVAATAAAMVAATELH